MTNSFTAFLSRHGEPAVIAIIENWERYVGLKAEATTPLEFRWQRLMRDERQTLAA